MKQQQNETACTVKDYDMREKILNMLEKNSRIDIKDMAVMLGISEPEVANEIADMEKSILYADIIR